MDPDKWKELQQLLGPAIEFARRNGCGVYVAIMNGVGEIMTLKTVPDPFVRAMLDGCAKMIDNPDAKLAAVALTTKVSGHRN